MRNYKCDFGQLDAPAERSAEDAPLLHWNTVLPAPPCRENIVNVTGDLLYEKDYLKLNLVHNCAVSVVHCESGAHHDLGIDLRLSVAVRLQGRVLPLTSRAGLHVAVVLKQGSSTAEACGRG